MSSKAFSGQSPKRPHIIQGTGGIPAEVADTRSDVDNALKLLEGRDASLDYPEVDWIDGGPPPFDGGNVVIMGRNLLQGQAFASVSFGLTTSKLTFTAVRPGKAGNDYTVVIEDGGAIAVDLTGTVLTITAVLGVSTANAIATEVNDALSPAKGIIRCVSGGAGTTIAAAAATPMTGGTGEGWLCLVGGVDCAPAHATGTTPAATVSELTCTITVPDLSADGLAAADVANLVVYTDGFITPPTSLVLGA